MTNEMSRVWILTRSDEYWPGHYCILTWSILNIDLVSDVYWPHIFFGIMKQLITFHSANMVKWRTLDLVLSVVWPDLGLRPRSGQTTSSTRSRVLHFTMLTSWKVINCIICLSLPCPTLFDGLNQLLKILFFIKQVGPYQVSRESMYYLSKSQREA